MKTKQLIEVLNSSDKTKSARLLVSYIDLCFSRGSYDSVAEIISNMNGLFARVPKQIFVPVLNASLHGAKHSNKLKLSIQESIRLITEKGQSNWKVSVETINEITKKVKV